ncbi:MAG: glycoside hydrolase, partial [Candidatus Brocadiia bacterium]
MRKGLLLLAGVFTLIFAAGSFGAEQAYVNTAGMKMVPIEAGSFMMGQERGSDLPLSVTFGNVNFMGGEVDVQPVPKVVISKGFYMSATEVTNAQYEQFDPSHKEYRGKMGLSRGDDEAVVFVSWHDAVKYCQWLSGKEGKTYRLPTEAEWEYTCRAGTTTVYNTGDMLPEVFQQSPRHKDELEAVSTVVGQTPANAWGLHDMHGNVEEWCSDWYGPYEAYEQVDPVGRESGIWKSVRGGSHNVYIKSLRSANRLSNLAEDKHWLLGFRVVQGEAPAAKPLKSEEAHRSAQNVSQKKYDWQANKKSGAYFAEPLKYVLKPDDPAKEMFLFHNHVPTVTWCDNGDILAAWFSCARERNRELGIAASRFRRETGHWDKASAFFSAADRNMHGTGLFNIGGGK